MEETVVDEKISLLMKHYLHANFLVKKQDLGVVINCIFTIESVEKCSPRNTGFLSIYFYADNIRRLIIVLFFLVVFL